MRIVIDKEKSDSTKNDNKIIKTRFGKFNANQNDTLYIPYGLIGIDDKKEFILTDFLENKLANFRIMQSICDDNLSFIIMSYDIEKNLIDYNDIEKCLQAFDLNIDFIDIYLITSIYKISDQYKITLNVKAPLIVDNRTRWGVQYVFMNNKYSLKHDFQ